MNDLYLFEALGHAGSNDELYASATRVSHELGFKHFMHGLRTATSLTAPPRFTLQGDPQQWLAHYSQNDYQRVDPLITHCKSRVVPIAWNEKLFAKPAAAKIYAAARDFGLSDGITFPIHGPGVEVAMLTLIFPEREEMSERDWANLLGKGQLFAAYLHEASQRLLNEQKKPFLENKPLTEREKQCLLWAAAGKTSWEISQILHITERTVVFHMANAAEKMGAVNRRQAVAKAIMLGLINP